LSAPKVNLSDARSASFSAFRPVTGELHDLGPVHEAQPVVRHHLRLRIAPDRECVRPLANVTELERVVAEVDRVAVDDPADHRRQGPGAHDDQNLVDQPEALVDPTELDQRAALLVAGEPGQVRVLEAFADRRGLDRRRMTGFPVVATHFRKPGRDQQVAALDAVDAGILEQVPPDLEPAAGT